MGDTAIVRTHLYLSESKRNPVLGFRYSVVVAKGRLKSPNGRHITRRAIIGVTSIVSGQNCDVLTLIIAQLLP